MKRVVGLGGVFFQAQDAPALQAWYKRHLGIDVQAWGGASFEPVDAGGKPVATPTAWAIFPREGTPFAPGSAPFQINYRVDDLRGLLQVLRDEGCQVLDAVDESEFGTFGWVVDPEGNKIELWEPPAVR